jgi:tetratricopeptide (TPR) repeat protein
LAQVERERRKFELAEDLLALAHQDFKGLIEQDKANTTWQREQALAFEENGRLLLDVGRHDDSLTEFRKALDLRTQLTGLDPANSQWQVELAINRIETGELLAVDPNGRTEAKTELRCALDVLDRLPNERRHNAAAEQARARARRCMKSLSKASDDSLDARKPDPLTGQL